MGTQDRDSMEGKWIRVIDKYAQPTEDNRRYKSKHGFDISSLLLCSTFLVKGNWLKVRGLEF